MSIGIMEAVYRRGPRRLPQFNVLLSLANNADDETGICFPSIEYTARRARVSVSTVRRALDELERDGWIRTERRVVGNVDRHGKTRSGLLNRYHLSLEKLDYTRDRLAASERINSRVRLTRVREKRVSETCASKTCESPVQKPVEGGGNPLQNPVSRVSVTRVSQCDPPDPLYGVTVTKYKKQQKQQQAATTGGKNTNTARRIA